MDALFRFATLDADDFYTVCAALILENGGRAAADARRLCGRLQQAMR
ncbi:MAG: hypothetical protein ACLTSX_02390 [Collinsella sp.]